MYRYIKKLLISFSYYSSVKYYKIKKKYWQILAEEAHPLENLDGSAAREALSKAQQQLSSATTEQDKAEAAIAVEVAEALVQALP